MLEKLLWMHESLGLTKINKKGKNTKIVLKKVNNKCKKIKGQSVTIGITK